MKTAPHRRRSCRGVEQHEVETGNHDDFKTA
jgi:hypothetical protein